MVNSAYRNAEVAWSVWRHNKNIFRGCIRTGLPAGPGYIFPRLVSPFVVKGGQVGHIFRPGCSE